MALTITKTVARQVDYAGIRRKVIVSITPDSDYVSGGESLTAQDVGLSKIEYCPPIIFNGSMTDYSGIVIGTYDYTNSKLILYGQLTSDQLWAEIATATDCSPLGAARVEIVGF